MNCWLIVQTYLYTIVPSAPWPKTFLGLKVMLPTLTILESSSDETTHNFRQWNWVKIATQVLNKHQQRVCTGNLNFSIRTPIFVLIGRASELRNGQVGVVGGAGGDVGAAVVWTFGTSAGHLQIVTVWDQAQAHVCRGEWLLSLEQLQPLLHLPLELLVLQLLLLVNTLWWQRKLYVNLEQ